MTENVKTWISWFAWWWCCMSNLFFYHTN